jgi:hypothetical protein
LLSARYVSAIDGRRGVTSRKFQSGEDRRYRANHKIGDAARAPSFMKREAANVILTPQKKDSGGQFTAPNR